MYIYIYISIFGFSHHAWVCLRPQKQSRQKILDEVLHCFSLNRFVAQLHPPIDTILVLYLAWPYLILPELSWLYKTTFPKSQNPGHPKEHQKNHTKLIKNKKDKTKTWRSLGFSIKSIHQSPRLSDSRFLVPCLPDSRLSDSCLSVFCLLDFHLSDSCLLVFCLSDSRLLTVAGLLVAKLQVVGLRVVGLLVAGLQVAGLWVVGLLVAGLQVAGLWVARSWASQVSWWQEMIFPCPLAQTRGAARAATVRIRKIE